MARGYWNERRRKIGDCQSSPLLSKKLFNCVLVSESLSLAADICRDDGGVLLSSNRSSSLAIRNSTSRSVNRIPVAMLASMPDGYGRCQAP